MHQWLVDVGATELDSIPMHPRLNRWCDCSSCLEEEDTAHSIELYTCMPFPLRVDLIDRVRLSQPLAPTEVHVVNVRHSLGHVCVLISRGIVEDRGEIVLLLLAHLR